MLTDLEKRKAALSVEKRAEFERRLQGNCSHPDAGIQSVSRSSAIPLSYAQERVWLHEQLFPGSLVHNRPANIRVRGPLKVSALRQALHHVVQRHEALRTRVVIQGGEAWQRIEEAPAFDLSIADVSSERDAEARIGQLAFEIARRPFDLQKGQLLHARLVRISAEDHLLLLTFHHFAFDAWSQSVLTRELADNYKSFTIGQMPEQNGLPIQFADYAAWERRPSHSSKLETSRSYWKKSLHDPPVLQLPTDVLHPAHPHEGSGQVGVRIPPNIAMALRDLAHDENTTQFAALLAGFTVLLHRYSQQDDIIVGCPVAGRSHIETENLIGVFINMLPLRTRLVQGSTFRQLVRQIRDTTIDALKHQDVPFQQIVQDVLANRDPGLHPLFQSLFIYENLPLEPRHAANVAFEPQNIAPVALLVDLSLELVDSPNGIEGYLCFRQDRWGRASIERMVEHFLHILEATVTDPDRPFDTLTMMSELECRQLLVEWNETTTDYPRDKCLHELFEALVKSTPDAIAIVADEQQLTYRELNERANRLAHHLRSQGVTPDVMVGLCFKRSTDLLVSILGVLKAGGAYVPLDPEYPLQRLEFMLQDAAIEMVITVTALLERLPSDLPRYICLDADADVFVAQNGDNPCSFARPENIAYVIYTSGSTGKPKGVLVEHRSVVNLLTSATNLLDLRSGDRFLGFASPTFDISVAEMFLPLCVGGVTVMPDRDIVFESDLLGREIRKHRPRVIQATPATWELLADYQGWSDQEQILISTGEALPTPLATRLLKMCGSLWDFYGPTETTIWSTAHRVTTPNNSIGRPIGNTKTFVLDGRRQLAPIGVWGELYIGGDGLARGYLNRPELTSERFVVSPFAQAHDRRLYRTGDRVRWRADGTLEYNGRLDNQVKLRGFRIELGEIEAALREHDDVAQCVVLLREDRPDDKRLVAYWVPRNGNQDAELRAFILKRLPHHMVPSAFVLMNSLPVTTSGKLDRASLPAPDTGRTDFESCHVAPRNNVEDSLADIWSDVLKIDQIGVHDNFFRLGGHSLSATQAVARAGTVLIVDLRLRDLFDAPTIAELADRVMTLRTGLVVSAPNPPTRVDRQTIQHLPASFAQERMWFLEQLEGELAAYNVPYAFHLQGPLDVESLRKAVETIIHRHEPLRTNFEIQDGKLVQLIRPPATVDLPLIDLSDLRPDAREAELTKRCREESERRFDLSHDLLLRAIVVRRAERSHTLLFVLHHIAWDGWSQQILWHELEKLYSAYRRDETPTLAPLPIQYVDYALWQRSDLQGERLSRQVVYWQQQLSELPALELPTDRPMPANLSSQGACHNFELDHRLVRLLQQLSVNEGVTLQMTLLTAFNVLMGCYSGQQDFAVGTPIAARNHVELETQIGMFVNTLVLRANLSGNPTFRELLARVRTTSVGAYDHQELPFEKLVEELQPERHVDRTPFFQVMFQLVCFSSEGPKLPDLEACRFTPSQKAKFDLEMQLWTHPQGVRGGLIYRSVLFEETTIRRMCEHFVALLEAIVANPDRTISELPLGNQSLPCQHPRESSSHAILKPPGLVRSKYRYEPPRTDTERILTDVWQSALKITRASIHDDFFELGGHSILAARVCIELEKRLGHRVPLALLFAAPTIHTLAKEVARDHSSQQAVAVVPLQPIGKRSPLFLMPSLSGSPLSWKDLLEELSNEQPVFAVGLTGQNPPWGERASLPEIASHFVSAIRHCEVNGPIHIMGHSFGGMLAYEVACQLHDAGAAVGRVLVVDTGPEQVRRNSRGGFLRKLSCFLANATPWIWQYMTKTSLSHKHYELCRMTRAWKRQVLSAVSGRPAIIDLDGAVDTRNIPEEFRKRMETNYHAFKTYVPGTFSGNIVLFRARMRPLLHGFTPDLNWGEVATGALEVIDIPGNHGTILQRPNINILAKQLQTLIDMA